MLPLIIFILITVAVVSIGTGLFAPLNLSLRLRDDTTQAGLPKKPVGLQFNNESLTRLFKPLGFLINPLHKKLTYIDKLKYQTDILKIDLNVYVLIGFKIILTIIFGMLGFKFLAHLSIAYACLAPLIGFFLLDYLMWQKVKQKKEAIVRYFPETVDLLHMCINAGADLISAVKWIIEKSSSNPFVEQLGVVLSEVQVGKPRAEALRDMAKRLQLADISSFVRVIVQAERMGTPVEEAFENLSSDTRERRFQNGERYAIKASLKILFPLVFCILPAIMIIVAGPIIIKFSQGDMLTPSF